LPGRNAKCSCPPVSHLSKTRRTRSPNDERQRLAALREYRVVDTKSEQVFDDFTALAAHVCGTPMAMISLVDETRQWFKARVGIRSRGTPRNISFCTHAILQANPLIVSNATRDARFAHSPLVTKPPRVRFYAGFPLINPDGYILGTLCVADRRPRRLTARQRKAMKVLARQVMAQLEAKRVSSHLAEALRHLKTLRGLLPICAWCKRIRDDHGYWTQVDAYIRAHTHADFTHGICPDCLAKELHPKPAARNGR
jgi:GAF domain-containing protein